MMKNKVKSVRNLIKFYNERSDDDKKIKQNHEGHKVGGKASNRFDPTYYDESRKYR